MKRPISLALAVIVLLSAVLPAHAQTYPPGGAPPGQPQMPYCNHAGYAIPTPRIGGAVDPIVTSEEVATVQASEIDRATTAITHEVWRVKDKPAPLDWVIEFVGVITTPAAMGICATSGTNAERTTSNDIPDIIIDPDAPAHAGIGAGDNFFRDCVNVLDEMNQAFLDMGWRVSVILPSAATCLPFFWATVKATCLTLGPAMVETLQERAVMFRRNAPSAWSEIIASTYENTARLMQINLNTFCLARNLI